LRRNLAPRIELAIDVIVNVGHPDAVFLDGYPQATVSTSLVFNRSFFFIFDLFFFWLLPFGLPKY